MSHSVRYPFIQADFSWHIRIWRVLRNVPSVRVIRAARRARIWLIQEWKRRCRLCVETFHVMRPLRSSSCPNAAEVRRSKKYIGICHRHLKMLDIVPALVMVTYFILMSWPQRHNVTTSKLLSLLLLYIDWYRFRMISIEQHRLITSVSIQFIFGTNGRTNVYRSI